MRTPPRPPKYRHSVGPRLLIPIAAAVVLSLFLSATLYSAAGLRDALDASTQAYVLDTTAQLADDVSVRLDAHLRELWLAADSIPMLHREDIEEFLARKRAISGFDILVLVDRSGVCIPSGYAADMLPGQDCIEAAFRGSRGVAQVDGAHLSFAAPASSQRGEVDRVLVGVCGQAHLDNMTRSPSFSGQGESCIVDSRGQVVAAPVDTPLFDQVDQAALSWAASALEEGRSGLIRLTLGDGAAVLLAYHPLEVNDWALITLVPADLISGEADAYIRSTYLIIGGIILAFALLLVLLTRFNSAHKRQLERIAYVDPVTGGRNNAAFQAGYRRLTAGAPGGSYTVALLNVKGFKLINERFGIEAGDRVLRQIHQALCRRLGPQEIAARGESDQFFLCLAEGGQEAVRQRLQAMIADINAHLGLPDGDFALSFFQGACLVDNPALEVTIVQDRARTACQLSREASDGGCIFYDAALSSRLKLEQALSDQFAQALRDQDFRVYLQPKVSLADHRVAGAEALVRWDHPQRGMIPPDAFIPLLERTGKIVELDLYMFRQVCVLLDHWRRSGRGIIPISVNLSRQHFKHPDFLQRFAQVAAGFDIPPWSIEFELTESIFFDRPQIAVVKERIHQMHAMGFACSLDDFGAGFSSLGLLKEFDVDTIKLDRQFFLDLSTQRARDVIACLLALADKLRAKTVAEGIETQEQLALLEEMGCGMVQGYVFSKPLPVSAFERWADQWEKNTPL